MEKYSAEQEKQSREFFKKNPCKLKDELKNHIGRYIKVGSGGAYFFCDKAKDNILDVMQNASENYYQGLIISECRLVNQISNHPLSWENRRTRRRNELKESGYSDSYIESEINKMYGYEEDDLRIKIAQLKNLRKRIADFTSFLERNVVAIYGGNDWLDNETIIPSTIILFDGDEKGPYWSYDEYNKGVAKEDLELEEGEN